MQSQQQGTGILLAVPAAPLHNGAAAPPEPKAIRLLPQGCRILAVGEGDFAFSEALSAARRPLDAGLLVATSLDTEAELRSKYAGVAERLARIRSTGAEVICGVDARCLAGGRLAGAEPFDRIVFNFPLLPVTEIEARSGLYDVHLANRAMLVEFLRSAPSMLRPDGIVVIASKDCFPYSWWRVEAMPQWSGGELAFVGMLPWQYTEYPSLYSGPCNVNRDASVKPTDAVIFAFARPGSSVFGTYSGNLVSEWNHSKGRVRLTPCIGQLQCLICNVNGLSEQDLAQHEAGKIHRKRAALEQRWEARLARGGALSAPRRLRAVPRSLRLRVAAALLLTAAAATAVLAVRVLRPGCARPPPPSQPGQAWCGLRGQGRAQGRGATCL
mmetsp:Transcript_44415/g.139261  ORF Transcript_44415/g.139261 Transcript_44415/m.139261 type:complete len:384 (+) Transcript_44415:56-1207(+)